MLSNYMKLAKKLTLYMFKRVNELSLQEGKKKDEISRRHGFRIKFAKKKG